ncbi:hypothetical protein K0M31_000133, partial [Melipona bicolor]
LLDSKLENLKNRERRSSKRDPIVNRRVYDNAVFIAIPPSKARQQRAFLSEYSSGERAREDIGIIASSENSKSTRELVLRPHSSPGDYIFPGSRPSTAQTPDARRGMLSERIAAATNRGEIFDPTGKSHL